MVAELVVRRVGRTELDHARLVARLTLLGPNDLKTMPLGGTAPGRRSLLVELGLNSLGRTLLEELDVFGHISGITGAHQRLSGFGLYDAVENRATAFTIRLARLARASLKGGIFVFHIHNSILAHTLLL